MRGGGDRCFARLPSLELKAPILFGGKTLTYLSVERCRGADGIPEARGGLVDFMPTLSLMLQEDPNADTGLITRIDYAPFSLSGRHLEVSPTSRYSGILVPDAFAVGNGEHYQESPHYERLGGGDLGTDGENGVLGRIAAETIEATAEVIRGIGYGTLTNMFIER